MNTTTLLGTLKGHNSKLCMLSYHPGVPGLLATCDTTGILILWDSHKQAKVIGVLCLNNNSQLGGIPRKINNPKC